MSKAFSSIHTTKILKGRIEEEKGMRKNKKNGLSLFFVISKHFNMNKLFDVPRPVSPQKTSLSPLLNIELEVMSVIANFLTDCKSYTSFYLV